jgi:prepilin-type N-terminal cleavage/methylation domain-containing protein
MNRLSQNKGFTFFEVMATVAILATGVVFVYKALFLTLDFQEQLSHRLYALQLLDKKIAEIKIYYKEYEDLPMYFNGQVDRVYINNRLLQFQYLVDFNSIFEIENLKRVDLSVAWREKGRVLRLSRTSFFPIKEEK